MGSRCNVRVLFVSSLFLLFLSFCTFIPFFLFCMFLFSLLSMTFVYCKVDDDDDDDVPIDLSPPQVGSGSVDCANSPLIGCSGGGVTGGRVQVGEGFKGLKVGVGADRVPTLIWNLG